MWMTGTPVSDAQPSCMRFVRSQRLNPRTAMRGSRPVHQSPMTPVDFQRVRWSTHPCRRQTARCSLTPSQWRSPCWMMFCENAPVNEVAGVQGAPMAVLVTMCSLMVKRTSHGCHPHRVLTSLSCRKAEVNSPSLSFYCWCFTPLALQCQRVNDVVNLDM